MEAARKRLKDLYNEVEKEYNSCITYPGLEPQVRKLKALLDYMGHSVQVKMQQKLLTF